MITDEVNALLKNGTPSDEALRKLDMKLSKIANNIDS